MADLRALMKERKAASKRIDHPYARYTNSGQLSCSLCSLTVKNEVLWPAHLTSKVHRQNVRQQQMAAAQAEAEAAAASSPAVGGTKRSAEDDGDAEDGVGEAAGPAKRVRWEDEQAEETSTPISAPSTSVLPPGFFDNPSEAPDLAISQSIDEDVTAQQQPPLPEDDEMAEFEAFLAQEEPQASTSSAGPTTFSAQATISGGEVLYNKDDDEEGKANGDEEEGDDDDEDKETEEERLAREEREELMERIEQ